MPHVFGKDHCGFDIRKGETKEQSYPNHFCFHYSIGFVFSISDIDIFIIKTFNGSYITYFQIYKGD